MEEGRKVSVVLEALGSATSCRARVCAIVGEVDASRGMHDVTLEVVSVTGLREFVLVMYELRSGLT